jgi:hypothetical protein
MRILRTLCLTFLTCAAVAACAPKWPEQATVASLTEVLRQAGVEVSEGSEPAPEAFGAPGTAMVVNGQPVWVYAFADVAARQQAAQGLSPDGMTLGGQALAWPSRPSIWSVDRLLVVYAGMDGGLVLLLDGLLGDSLTVPTAELPEPYPPSVAAAIGVLAQDLGIPPQSVAVAAFEPHTWPDGCLGLPDPGEACSQAMVPGWSVVLMADSTRYTLRTDEVGAIVRREP